MREPSDWRPIVAALADADTRTLYAELVVGVDDAGSSLSPSRRRHATETLRSSGLLGDDGMPDPAVFGRVLAAAPKRGRPTGIQRFLTSEGRIGRYPSNAGERGALLAQIARAVLAPDEVVDERELTERLSAFTDDRAALRRYLVDEGLVERTRSGSQYALAETTEQPEA